MSYDSNKLNDLQQKVATATAKASYQIRQIPMFKDSVYLWNNHDFDFSQYISQKYDPDKLGFSDKGCVSTTLHDAQKLPLYADALLNAPMPDYGDIAGISDTDQDNAGLMQIKSDFADMKEPYPGFRDEYPEYFPSRVTGKGASSYFVKTGHCPTKIDNIIDCKEKGYDWVPNFETVPDSVKGFFKNIENPLAGKCYKPRYSFVDNTPKQMLPGMEGPVPSMFKTLETLNPLTFASILEFGADPSGSFVQLECKEDFIGDFQQDKTLKTHPKKRGKILNRWIHVIVIIILVIFGISMLYGA